MLTKYNEIWNKIKKASNIKFHSVPVYHEKYLKAKVNKLSGVVNTNILNDELPGESVHYTCVACISIDPFMKIGKKNYRQVYLQQCKYSVKKKKIPEFIDLELESDSDCK